MTEPRFINPHDRLIYVNRPDGHQIVVRPFRELGVLVGRQEKDCVVEGEHYRQFSQLAPFPEPEPVAASEGEGGSDLAAMAGKGGFSGSGDVIAPDGTVRSDADGEDPDGEVVEPDAEVEDADPASVIDDEVEDDDGDAEDEDDAVDDDADLEDVDGVGPKLAEQLRAIGVETASDLAEKQDDGDAQELADACDGIKGAAHAERLILAAQTLLGYEDADEDDTE